MAGRTGDTTRKDARVFLVSGGDQEDRVAAVVDHLCGMDGVDDTMLGFCLMTTGSAELGIRGENGYKKNVLVTFNINREQRHLKVELRHI